MDQQQFVAALNDYGCKCEANRNFLAAKLSFQQAVSLDQSSPLIWANLGALHRGFNEYDEAKKCFETALSLDPNFVSTYANYGLLLSEKEQWDEAHAMFDKALVLDPNNLATKWDKAMTYLDAGDLDHGLPLYDIRFEQMKQYYPKYKYPFWDGKNLDGKTIIIYEEQGSGDKILFTRFIHQLKVKYPTCHIYFLCTSDLHPLLWEYEKAGVCEFLPNAIIFPEGIDYGCWMMSLPRIMGWNNLNNVPDDPGFILERCMFQKKTIKLDNNLPNGKKIGICWHGNPRHTQDRFRSIPFEKFTKLMDDPLYTWFSLQVDDFKNDIPRCGMEGLITDCSPNINKEGFTKTGVILLNLDLIITCDTAVAHLAGALNIPVWMLVAKNPYWLWGRIEPTTPWYPSMRIFRQKKPNEWDHVIEEVKISLKELIS